MNGMSLSEYQWLLNWSFGIVGVLLGAFIKTLWDEMKSLREQQNQMRTWVHENTVNKQDFRDHAARVENMLERIFDRLDNKQDKDRS